jgi:hypothetical protein
MALNGHSQPRWRRRFVGGKAGTMTAFGEAGELRYPNAVHFIRVNALPPEQGGKGQGA